MSQYIMGLLTQDPDGQRNSSVLLSLKNWQWPFSQHLLFLLLCKENGHTFSVSNKGIGDGYKGNY